MTSQRLTSPGKHAAAFGALGFGTGNILAGAVFGAYRAVMQNNQFGSTPANPALTLLVYLLLPALAAGALGAALLALSNWRPRTGRAALAGAVGSALGYLLPSNTFLGLLGVPSTGRALIFSAIPAEPALVFLQPALIGLFTGALVGLALIGRRAATPVALAGAAGFVLGFLAERALLFLLSGLSLALRFHFPSPDILSPWYIFTWIIPYAVYGAIGGAILGAVIGRIASAPARSEVALPRA